MSPMQLEITYRYFHPAASNLKGPYLIRSLHVGRYRYRQLRRNGETLFRKSPCACACARETRTRAKSHRCNPAVADRLQNPSRNERTFPKRTSNNLLSPAASLLRNRMSGPPLCHHELALASGSGSGSGSGGDDFPNAPSKQAQAPAPARPSNVTRP